ncbi:MAG: M48 family metalloprotease [Deltaproteobacteria bacterium]|nr:M48 family metalloprotease [Deltaproteobacteria bacterium]
MSVLGTGARASILPKNDLDQQDNSFGPSNVTEEQFNKITDAIVDMWQPLAQLHGAKLVAIKAWNDSTVNAYAEQSGNEWRVRMFGGLARRQEVTADGFALVVCHELGHHFGGYAYKDGHWASAEGEADYFATHVCARRIWGTSTEKNAQLAQNRQGLTNACDAVWKDQDERNLCYRTTDAGLSLARLLGALGGETMPSTESRDMNKVERTVTYHPRAQCRMDTYLHGALCPAKFDLKVIPGNPSAGAGRNTPEAEAEAGKYSCMEAANFQVGYRPRCWFKALNEAKFGDDDGDLLTRNWRNLW